ncbi:MAG: fatty acid desaturase family protein [bacterium]
MKRSYLESSFREPHPRCGFRCVELVAIAAFAVLETTLVTRLALDSAGHGVTLALAVTLALVGIDFLSGLVHWAADTWGTPEWPLVGRTLIAPFREHHEDPLAITRHDFVETNGSSMLVALPAMLLAAAVPLERLGEAARLGVATVTFLAAGAVLTNQAHKWSHTARRPSWVVALQRAGLLVSREHHAVHHRAPHTRAYCITFGWLNPILDRVRFFPVLESWIQAMTGAVPRADDRAHRHERRAARRALSATR